MFDEAVEEDCERPEAVEALVATDASGTVVGAVLELADGEVVDELLVETTRLAAFLVKCPAAGALVTESVADRPARVVAVVGAVAAGRNKSQPSPISNTTPTSAAKNCHNLRRTARSITALSSWLSSRSQASSGKGVGSGSGGFSRWNALSISLSDHISNC
jgi:hypothetical protein